MSNPRWDRAIGQIRDLQSYLDFLRDQYTFQRDRLRQQLETLRHGTDELRDTALLDEVSSELDELSDVSHSSSFSLDTISTPEGGIQVDGVLQEVQTQLEDLKPLYTKLKDVTRRSLDRVRRISRAAANDMKDFLHGTNHSLEQRWVDDLLEPHSARFRRNFQTLFNAIEEAPNDHEARQLMAQYLRPSVRASDLFHKAEEEFYAGEPGVLQRLLYQPSKYFKTLQVKGLEATEAVLGESTTYILGEVLGGIAEVGGLMVDVLLSWELYLGLGAFKTVKDLFHGHFLKSVDDIYKLFTLNLLGEHFLPTYMKKYPHKSLLKPVPSGDTQKSYMMMFAENYSAEVMVYMFWFEQLRSVVRYQPELQQPVEPKVVRKIQGKVLAPGIDTTDQFRADRKEMAHWQTSLLGQAARVETGFLDGEFVLEGAKMTLAAAGRLFGLHYHPKLHTFNQPLERGFPVPKGGEVLALLEFPDWSHLERGWPPLKGSDEIRGKIWESKSFDPWTLRTVEHMAETGRWGQQYNKADTNTVRQQVMRTNRADYEDFTTGNDPVRLLQFMQTPYAKFHLQKEFFVDEKQFTQKDPVVEFQKYKGPLSALPLTLHYALMKELYVQYLEENPEPKYWLYFVQHRQEFVSTVEYEVALVQGARFRRTLTELAGKEKRQFSFWNLSHRSLLTRTYLFGQVASLAYLSPEDMVEQENALVSRKYFGAVLDRKVIDATPHLLPLFREGLRVVIHVWSLVSLVSSEEKEKKDTVMTVSFRGTQNLQEVLTDLDFRGKSLHVDGVVGSFLVHHGFYKGVEHLGRAGLYDGIQQALGKYTPRGIVVCGHSLGGAMAQVMCFKMLSLSRIRPACYTYASPFCMDRKGVRVFHTMVQEGVNVYLRGDPIPTVPGFLLSSKVIELLALEKFLDRVKVGKLINNPEDIRHIGELQNKYQARRGVPDMVVEPGSLSYRINGYEANDITTETQGVLPFIRNLKSRRVHKLSTILESVEEIQENDHSLVDDSPTVDKGWFLDTAYETHRDPGEVLPLDGEDEPSQDILKNLLAMGGTILGTTRLRDPTKEVGTMADTTGDVHTLTPGWKRKLSEKQWEAQHHRQQKRYSQLTM